MSDNDLIRRGDALERLELAEHDAEERDWRSGANEVAKLRKYVEAIPAVQPTVSPDVSALVELLSEARADLEGYVDHEWPADMRDRYPSFKSKWKRDMELCDRIDAALARVKEVDAKD